MANKRKKGSAIWLLCTEDPEDESQVQCNVCSIVLKKGGTTIRNRNTTNILRHMKKKHAQQLIDAENKIEEEKKVKASKQKKVSTYIDKVNKPSQALVPLSLASVPSCSSSNADTVLLESGSETSVQMNPFEYLEIKQIWSVNDARS